MGQFAISEASKDDVQGIRQLMSRVIERDVARDTLELTEMLENANTNLEFWCNHPQSCVHLVARSGSQVVAVILIKNFWNLCSLFVDSSLQGQGLGRGLVEAAAKRCRGKNERGGIFLNAAANAIPFYRRLGFIERVSSQPLPSGFLAMTRPF